MLPLLSLLPLLGCAPVPEDTSAESTPDPQEEPEPCMTVDPAALAFEGERLGEDDPLRASFAIRNGCEGPLVLDEVGLGDVSAPFTVAPLASLTVPHGSEVPVLVTFSPSGAGSFEAEVVIVSNDPEAPLTTVPLSGDGLAPILEVTPESAELGAPWIGCEVVQPVQVANVGNAELVVEAFTLTTPSASEFALAEVELPFTVSPDRAVDVEIRYTPLDVFEDSAYLTFQSNDPEQPSVTVGVSGTGTEYGSGSDSFVQPEEPRDTFELSQTPVPDGIAVKVDGTEHYDWSYDTDENAIVFESDARPEAGATVAISYPLLPDCDD